MRCVGALFLTAAVSSVAISLRQAAGTAFEIRVDVLTSLAGNGVDLGAAIEVAGTFAPNAAARFQTTAFDKLVAPASSRTSRRSALPSLRLARLRPALDAQEIRRRRWFHLELTPRDHEAFGSSPCRG